MNPNEIENPTGELPVNETDTHEVTAPKRKPRKPREAAVLTPETIDTTEQPARKPRNKKSNPAALAKQLIGLHGMAAMLPSLQFMQIDENEANALAAALTSFAEEHDVNISGKTGATIQLIAAVGMIYVPRAIYFAKVRKEAKNQAPLVVQSNMQENGANDSNTTLEK